MRPPPRADLLGVSAGSGGFAPLASKLEIRKTAPDPAVAGEGSKLRAQRVSSLEFRISAPRAAGSRRCTILQGSLYVSGIN